jgi:predicted metal-binding membrane protein
MGPNAGKHDRSKLEPAEIGKRPTEDVGPVVGASPPTTDDEARRIAARIAARLREAGFGCTTLNLVPARGTGFRSDRVRVVLMLTVLTVLAWCWLFLLSADMDHMRGMDMSGLRTIPSGMGLMVPVNAPWRAIEFAFVFIMWTVMMVGMMTPSAAPMILMYARLGRQVEAQGAPFAATAWFAAGYFLVWASFSFFAALAQWGLERAGLLDDRMASTSGLLGGMVFVAAGIYQWTRLKDACLAQCQTPFAFLMRQGGFRSDAKGCVMLGLRHGAYCLGCCWVLMALLFVGGVMNTSWIVLLASLVLLERVTGSGFLIARLAGVVLVATGAWFLLS